jgi:DNA-directed RNA polymerase specialized sigma24 family protein
MSEVTLPIEARTVALDFESFFRAEYRSLCQALVLLVGDPLEAEEIAQETMTRVLDRWDRVGVMDSPAGYAYPTALNLQRKRIRRLAVRVKRRFASVPVRRYRSRSERPPRRAPSAPGASRRPAGR